MQQNDCLEYMHCSPFFWQSIGPGVRASPGHLSFWRARNSRTTSGGVMELQNSRSCCAPLRVITQSRCGYPTFRCINVTNG